MRAAPDFPARSSPPGNRTTNPKDEAIALTTQITAPEQPSTAQRDGFMAALAAAEQFVSTSPVLPSSMDIRCYPWGPTPEIAPYFHHQPDAVRAFAEYFGGSVSEIPYSDGQVLTEARSEVNGVVFRAWSLTAAPVEAAAEVAPSSASAPDEWCSGCNIDHDPAVCGYRPEDAAVEVLA